MQKNQCENEVLSLIFLYCPQSSCVNFIAHLLRPSALLDLRNATGTQNLLSKFKQDDWAQSKKARESDKPDPVVEQSFI